MPVQEAAREKWLLVCQRGFAVRRSVKPSPEDLALNRTNETSICSSRPWM